MKNEPDIEAGEATIDDLLRFSLAGQDKQLAATKALTSAVLRQPAPIIENNLPQQPAPVVKFTPKPTTWHFQITARDSEGRIESFTATPQTT